MKIVWVSVEVVLRASTAALICSTKHYQPHICNTIDSLDAHRVVVTSGLGNDNRTGRSRHAARGQRSRRKENGCKN